MIITTILHTCKSDVQTIVLDEAAQTHPDSWWWLKTDGCDIVKGLKESTNLQRSGDVDLKDGSLQEQYETYRKRLEFVKKLGLNIGHCEVTGKLKRILGDISDDLKFIYSDKIPTINFQQIQLYYTVSVIVQSHIEQQRGKRAQNSK